jgi:hypothetical protein
MARKYEARPGWYAWNLEQCEEEILIAAYDEICRFIPDGQTWKYGFERRFFDHGEGVAVDFVDFINVVRKRRGLPLIVIRETTVYEYGRSPDKSVKSNLRRRIREELSSLSADDRQHRIEAAMAEEQRLPPPHMTYEEYRARQQTRKTESTLSREEVTKRLLAQQAANAAAQAPTKVTLSPERAAKMLTFATDPSLRGEIIQNLSADDAPEVAEKIENTELRDALVRHSLGAS